VLKGPVKATLPLPFTAKLHHVGSLYILTYEARKIKHKINCLIYDYLSINGALLLKTISACELRSSGLLRSEWWQFFADVSGRFSRSQLHGSRILYS
jgi:hypothetical protein